MKNMLAASWRGLAAGCLLLALGACGGGGGGSDGGTPPAATLSLSGNASVVEGGSAVPLTLTGASASSGNITWSLSPSIGSLSAATSGGATFQPPALDQLSADTTVTVTASPEHGSAVSTRILVTLVPFTVASASPKASDADVGVVPAVTFSRAMDPGSLNETSVRLSSPVAAVPADLAASGAAAVSVTPKAPLVWGTRYKLSLSPSVLSARRQALPATSVEFATKSATWGESAALSTTTVTNGVSAPVFDGRGNAFAVWLQNVPGVGWNILAARHDAAGKTWSAPVTLRGDGRGFATAVAADAAGNAVAVWAAWDTVGGAGRIHVSRYAAATGTWSVPQQIPAPNALSSLNPQVAMDPLGNAIVSWQQYLPTGLDQQVFVTRYAAQSDTWSTPVGLSGTGHLLRDPTVKLDSQGNAIAVWSEGPTFLTVQITSRRFAIATGAWDAPRVLQSGSGAGGNPQLAFDAKGNAAVVWTEAVAGGYPVQISRYTAGSDTWAAPETVSTAPGTGDWPQVRMDAGGNTFVLWQQSSAGNAFAVNVARYDAAGSTWTRPPALDPITPAAVGSPYRGFPSLTVDAAGNAMVFWTRDVGGNVYRLFNARYDSATASWGTVAQMSMTGGLAAGGPSGEVLLLWDKDIGASILNPQWVLYTGR
ncbi:Ig-like domain-containing protein [Roseateles chitinivorans]|uniref:Ig-like domain-containing protein n=1 Tax=Roseateles chitinivorans TaxID=2917965 RepID=UPI003D669899